MNTKIQNLPVDQVPSIGSDFEKGAEVGCLNAILNTIRTPMLMLYPDFRVKTSNKAFNELFHVSTSETENRFVYELGAGHWNVSALRDQLAGTLSGESNLKDFEVSAHFPRIGERTMLLNAEKLEQAGFEAGLILLSIHDITERKKIEGANRWMSALVESSDDATISKDLNGIIRSCNEGAARLFGYTTEELIGKPMTMLIPNDHQNEETEILERIRHGRRIEHFETIRRRKDGSLIEVSLAVSPVKDVHGKIVGASKIARDITDRKRSEKELAESYVREKAAREQAEAANHAKDDFLASLSHELRTPLNPVLLIASDASENPDLPADIRKSFEIIRKNVELEARLIDDLLDLTRITHGKLSLHPRTIDIREIVEETIATIQSEINEKQISLVVKWNSPQTCIFGDDIRLQQVFWNILKNAVKFTASFGKISIETSLANGRLQVKITDTGIGMAPNEISRIFDAFSQGDHAKIDAHRFGGLGLGLAISRRLVEMHSGHIRAYSAGLNMGSTFIIELPLVESKNTASLPDNVRPLAGQGKNSNDRNISILLVEDHEPTLMALEHLLTRRKFHVMSAANINEAKNVAAREKIDFVISDIGLPDGNGNVLMKELRQKYGLKGIALTGYGMERDIEECLASGFVSHLIKPINIRALKNALEALISN